MAKQKPKAKKPKAKPKPKAVVKAKAKPKAKSKTSAARSKSELTAVKKRAPRKTSRRRRPAKSTAPEGTVRIQKHLAEIGIASRRAVEEMIEQGLIAVNDKVVRKLPCFVNPQTDVIHVEGVRVKTRRVRHVYYLVNKPKGVVCTASDPQGRKRAVDMVGPIGRRVYCVGRLDVDSTGLLLLTNDGELTQHMTHPSHEVPKTYVVTVDGRLDADSIDKLKRGVYLDGTRTQGAWVKIASRSATSTVLEISLREGRNREIRRILLRLGHKVRRLRRIAIGPITDRGLKIGHVRQLLPQEVDLLRKSGTGGKDS
ncbi:MAG: rRNA pseudouridine synthase [Phycisphaerae bacterium]|nr:rRNA pseudouridine synthase [Phycisphaerae bacterium]